MKRIPSTRPAHRSSAWLLAAGLLLVSGSCGAIGFGGSSPAAALGQALDFRVDLRLADGEALDPGCLRASVRSGDNRLPADAVMTQLESGDRPAVRVRTRTRILEPVVTINIAAGCPTSLSREFVLFADPPLVSALAAVGPAGPAPHSGAAPAAAEDAPVAAPGGTVRTGSPTVPPQRRAASKSPPARRQGPAGGAGASAGTVMAEAARTPRLASDAARPPRPARTVRAGEGGPRLRLDAAAPAPAGPASAAEPSPEPPRAAPLDAQALALIEQANEAVKAAIDAASASQARMGELEQELRRLRAETDAQQAQLQLLRQQAQQSETHSLWLLLLTVATLGLAGWLWWRLRQAEHLRRRAWLEAARQPGAAARSAVAAPVVPPPPSQVPLLVERSVRSAGRAALGAGLAPAHQPTPSELPLDPPPQPAVSEPAVMQTRPLLPPDAADARDVSAEELIDLEQQAEFFLVLGQDDEAIELLVAHLRQTAGASPLPYLKLMDIYGRHGDEAAYRRTRERFNHRFQARAPGWAERDRPARDLEDYPAVLAILTKVWPRPLDALAQLEALIFRRGGSELLDLPAYRDLLFLYGLVRDHLDGLPTTAHGRAVDVLLPLDQVQPDLFEHAAGPGNAAMSADLDPATLPMARRPATP